MSATERPRSVSTSYDFVTVSTLLRDGVYEVPDYQRNYAWEADQLRDLWEDLEGMAASAEHYTGTVIVKKLQDYTRLGKAFARFELIDGQQRLTSTVILLNSLCDELRRRNTPDGLRTADNIETEYIHDLATDTYKLRLNRGDDPYLKDVVLRSFTKEMVGREAASPSEIRLLAAKRYFLGRIATFDDSQMDALLSKVLSGIRFTRFQVASDAEAGLIFEVTNNRGRPLNELDKIKNYLMYVAYKAGDPQLATEINEAWVDVLKNVMASGRVEEQEILRYHWVMRTGEPKEYEIHRRLKSKFTPPFKDTYLAEVREYVSSLKEASYVIRELSQPDDAFSDFPDEQARTIRNHLIGLHRLKAIATVLPLLLSARITLRHQPELFGRIVAACEAFAFRVYKVANRRADAGLTMFAEQAKLMFDARGDPGTALVSRADDAIATIADYIATYGDDLSVSAALSAENVFAILEGYEIRYLLGEYERWKCIEAKEKPLPWDELEKATIEHILPQTPADSGAWTEEDWQNHNKIVNNLGNLTLTYWNSQLSNKPFEDKQVRYKDSNLGIQRELADEVMWKRDDIGWRRESIIKFVFLRWPSST
jgi:hypothetical protein